MVEDSRVSAVHKEALPVRLGRLLLTVAAHDIQGLIQTIQGSPRLREEVIKGHTIS